MNLSCVESSNLVLYCYFSICCYDIIVLVRFIPNRSEFEKVYPLSVQRIQFLRICIFLVWNCWSTLLSFSVTFLESAFMAYKSRWKKKIQNSWKETTGKVTSSAQRDKNKKKYGRGEYEMTAVKDHWSKLYEGYMTSLQDQVTMSLMHRRYIWYRSCFHLIEHSFEHRCNKAVNLIRLSNLTILSLTY